MSLGGIGPEAIKRTPQEKIDFLQSQKESFHNLDPSSFYLADLEILFRDVEKTTLTHDLFDNLFFAIPPCIDLPLEVSVIQKYIDELALTPYYQRLAIVFSYLQQVRKQNGNISPETLSALMGFIHQSNQYNNREKRNLTIKQYDLMNRLLWQLQCILPPREPAHRVFDQSLYAKIDPVAAWEAFLLGSEEAITFGIEEIKNSINAFETLLAFFSEKRSAIDAIQKDYRVFEAFADVRKDKDQLTTALFMNQYMEHGKRLQRVVSFVRDQPGSKVKEERDGWIYEVEVEKIDSIFECITSIEKPTLFSVPMSIYNLTEIDQGPLAFLNYQIDFIYEPARIYHTSPKNIPAVLEVVKFYFEKVRESKEEDSFLENMALFRFFFAHACPFVRGSAAIAEWFEQSLSIAILGKKLVYGSRNAFEMSSGDLDALTSITPSEYFALYKQQVKLETL